MPSHPFVLQTDVSCRVKISWRFRVLQGRNVINRRCRNRTTLFPHVSRLALRYITDKQTNKNKNKPEQLQWPICKVINRNTEWL